MSDFDWLVVWPMLALAAGSALCFLLGAFAPRSTFGPSLALLAIGAAFLLQGRVWEAGAGVAFSGLYESSPQVALLGMLFLLLTAISWGFSNSFFGEDEHRSEFCGLLLLAPVGMFLMAGARDLLLLFLGVEILSIPLYFLCAFRKERADSVESGLKYFLLGAFAAAFLLFGIALLYAASGSMSLPEIAKVARSATGGEAALLRAGLAMLLVGLLFKASLAPFHLWTPDVYEGAPTPVTALMAGGTKAAAFAALANVAPLLGPNELVRSDLGFGAREWLVPAAILTLAIGNFGALVQTSLKRMLAYSGVAHAGVLLIGVLALPSAPEARQALLFYLFAYGLTAAGAFGLVAYLERKEGEEMVGIEGYRGLAQRRPWAAAALALFFLSLGGIPPTAGFLGKYLVFAAAVEAGMTWLAVVGILFSVAALAYYLRVVVHMYMLPNLAGEPPLGARREAYAAIAAGAAAAGVVAFGVSPGTLLRLVGG